MPSSIRLRRPLLRNKFESEIHGLVTEAILESGTTEDNASGRVVEIELTDNRGKKLYEIKGLKEEFSVNVLVKIRKTRSPWRA